MNKDDFLNSTNVEADLAEEAWEQADGDETDARALLATDRLVVKGRFSAPDEGFYGVLMADWSVARSSLNDLKVIVLGNESADDLDPGMRAAEFKSQIEQLMADGSKMGGYTDQLTKALRKFWSNPQSDLRELVDAGDYGSLETVVQSFIAENLELGSVSLVLDTEEELKVEKTSTGTETSTTSSQQSTPDVEIPCKIEINPVRGLPVSQISPGDYIYVEPGEVEASNKPIVKELEKHRDDSGMIPAKVKAKSSTEAGNLRIDLEFDRNVRGKVSCGKDVSILVPDSTKQRQSASSSGLTDTLENEFVIGLSLGLALLIVLGIWYFLF